MFSPVMTPHFTFGKQCFIYVFVHKMPLKPLENSGVCPNFHSMQFARR